MSDIEALQTLLGQQSPLTKQQQQRLVQLLLPQLLSLPSHTLLHRCELVLQHTLRERLDRKGQKALLRELITQLKTPGLDANRKYTLQSILRVVVLSLKAPEALNRGPHGADRLFDALFWRAPTAGRLLDRELTRLEPGAPGEALIRALKGDLTFVPALHPRYVHCGLALGKGQYAVVYKAVDITTGRAVAIKTMMLSQLRNLSADRLEQEVTLMRSIQHPNVVALTDVFYDDATGLPLHLVMELCPGGDLAAYLRERGRLPEPEARRLFVDLINGLSALHARNMMHRDLKPANIMLGDIVDDPASPGYPFTLKLADFTFAVQLSADQYAQSMLGTPIYIAPEVWLNTGAGYSFKSEVFSIGCVLYEMVQGMAYKSRIFGGDSHKLVAQRRVDATDADFEGISPQLRLLLSRMLRVDPGQRASLADVAADPWLSPPPPAVPQQPAQPPASLVAVVAAATTAATTAATIANPLLWPSDPAADAASASTPASASASASASSSASASARGLAVPSMLASLASVNLTMPYLPPSADVQTLAKQVAMLREMLTTALSDIDRRKNISRLLEANLRARGEQFQRHVDGLTRDAEQLRARLDSEQSARTEAERQVDTMRAEVQAARSVQAEAAEASRAAAEAASELRAQLRERATELTALRQELCAAQLALESQRHAHAAEMEELQQHVAVLQAELGHTRTSQSEAAAAAAAVAADALRTEETRHRAELAVAHERSAALRAEADAALARAADADARLAALRDETQHHIDQLVAEHTAAIARREIEMRTESDAALARVLQESSAFGREAQVANQRAEMDRVVSAAVSAAQAELTQQFNRQQSAAIAAACAEVEQRVRNESSRVCQQRVEDADRQAAARLRQLESDRAAERASAAAEQCRLQESLTQMQDELAQARQRSAAAIETDQQSRRRLDELTAAVSELKQQLVAAEQVAEEALTRWHTQSEALTRERDQARNAAAAELQRVADAAEAERKAAAASAASMRADMDALRKMCEQLRAEAMQSSAELHQAHQVVEELLAGNHSTTADAVRKASADLAATQAKLAEQVAVRGQLEMQMAAIQSQVAKCVAQINARDERIQVYELQLCQMPEFRPLPPLN